METSPASASEHNGMGDDMKKVLPGDPLRIPARTWNAVLDATRAQRESQPIFRPGSGASLPPGTALAYNASGEAAPAGGVVELINRTSAARPLEFTKPGKSEGADVFAIALEPIAAGGIGRIALSGGPWPILIKNRQCWVGNLYVGCWGNNPPAGESPMEPSWEAQPCPMTATPDFRIVNRSTNTEEWPAQATFFSRGEGLTLLYKPKFGKVISASGGSPTYYDIPYYYRTGGGQVQHDNLAVWKFEQPWPMERSFFIAWLPNNGTDSIVIAASPKTTPPPYENHVPRLTAYWKLKLITQDFDYAHATRAMMQNVQGISNWNLVIGDHKIGSFTIQSGSGMAIASIAQLIWQPTVIYGITIYMDKLYVSNGEVDWVWTRVDVDVWSGYPSILCAKFGRDSFPK
jgi:hypothetical protein